MDEEGLVGLKCFSHETKISLTAYILLIVDNKFGQLVVQSAQAGAAHVCTYVCMYTGVLTIICTTRE